MIYVAEYVFLGTTLHRQVVGASVSYLALNARIKESDFYSKIPVFYADSTTGFEHLRRYIVIHMLQDCKLI